MPKQKIYLKNWLDMKPYKTQYKTDEFYLGVCNDVRQSLVDSGDIAFLESYLDEKMISVLACLLTSYLEDLVSETNIWNSFVRVHKKHYGKCVPFYEADDYYEEEEINLTDVCFLMWYFLNTLQGNKFVFPLNMAIIKLSIEVMTVFDSVWEYAPENDHLKTFYQIDETEKDFYKVRNLIDNLLFKSYLFYYDSLLDLRESSLEIMDQNEGDVNLVSYLNDDHNRRLHNSHTRLMSFRGNQWVSEVLGAKHPLAKSIGQLSKKVNGHFFYKGQDKENIFIEHIASGKKFDLTKKSFDHSDNLQEIDTILGIGIVNWQDEWWFSGIYFQREFDANIVLDEKSSTKSRMEVAFLDNDESLLKDILDRQEKAFRAATDMKPVAFMSGAKMDEFMQNHVEYYNESLNLSKKEEEEAQQRAKNEGVLNFDEGAADLKEESESGLIFFNPKSGLEMAFSVNSAFPLKNNPFFNEAESREQVMDLFMNPTFSPELAKFCVENFKDKLPFFNDAEGGSLVEDCDFLLRFFKRRSYFSKPSISFTGRESV